MEDVEEDMLNVDVGDESESKASPSTEQFVFNPKEMLEHFTMMVYGSTGTGKTHVTTHILSEIHDRFKEIHLFSGSIEDQPDAWEFIPDIHKHEGLEATALDSIIAGQKKEISKWTKLIKKKSPSISGDKLRDAISKKVGRVCIILDDLIDDPKVRQSRRLLKLFVSGRHLRMSLIFLSQSPAKSAAIGIIMRSNVHYCMTSEFDSFDDQKAIASMFFCKKGLKCGMERLDELTETVRNFAVSACYKRGKKELSDHTCSYRAPKNLKKFTLKSTKDLANAMHVSDSVAKRYGERSKSRKNGSKRPIGFEGREYVGRIDFDRPKSRLRTFLK